MLRRKTFSRVISALLAAATSLAACATPPPSNPGNACAIFSERKGWWHAVRASEKHWGAPAELQLAFLNQESSFESHARPPHKKLLFVIPTPMRESSSAGYAQATRSTWDRYKDDTGHAFADRNNFADAADFVGWYVHKSRRQSGIALEDAYNQYLAYEEGPGAFNTGAHKKNHRLQRTAAAVASRAATYRAQLAGCRKELDGKFLFFF
jgi:hypothetical protein